MAGQPQSSTLAFDQGTTRPVLDVRNLSTTFRTPLGPLPAVNDVSFQLERGRTLAVIGESGSGKSAMLRSILGTHPTTAASSGEVFLAGRDLLALSARERRNVRGKEISLVFQDPMTALDPVYTVAQQLTETIRQHLGGTKSEARARALQALQRVQIPSPEDRLDAYPFELSGGMRQRVVIAMAIVGEPTVLLADEPTTALDVTVQAKILRLFRSLQRELGMALVIVTHDLGVAATIADDIAVMYAGRVVEYGTVRRVLGRPEHPYTKALMESNVMPGQTVRPKAIVGTPPRMTRLPDGCSFAPRCDFATVQCWQAVPSVVDIDSTHWSRCFFAGSGELAESRADVVA